MTGPIRLQSRKEGVDVLRGIVMVLMCLDHTRYFFSKEKLHVIGLNVMDITPGLFFTRWISHFCAPVFTLLAGVCVFLSLQHIGNIPEISKNLLKKGLWLVFLELTLVRLAWTFNFDTSIFHGKVLWSLGWSFVVLAGLVYFSVYRVMIFGIFIILVHNLFDYISPEMLGEFDWIWKILHVPGRFRIYGRSHFEVIYPLIPWIAVISVGFGLGKVFMYSEASRRRILSIVGIFLTISFVFIRFFNGYGNPKDWIPQVSPLMSFISFMDVEKYPPSLFFLLITIGPSLYFLAYVESLPSAMRRFLSVYGRVPLFFYVAHLFFIHGLAVVIAKMNGVSAQFMFEIIGPRAWPSTWGYSLSIVYIIWIGVVGIFYPLCTWYWRFRMSMRNI